MALRKCKECGHEISKKAKSCPSCASPQKKKTSALVWLIAILAVAIFIVNMVDSDRAEEQKQQQAAAQQKIDEKNSKHFKENQQQILNQITAFIDKKDFNKAAQLSNKYNKSNNLELKKLNGIAREQLILIELKSIPTSENEKNLSKYKELSKIAPENQKYVNKIKHYQTKIARINMLQKGFSGWNGSHVALDRYLKKNMKDPDSYEHISTKYIDKGDHLLLYTKYRANNSFGGMTIGNVTAKAAIDGKLIEIITSN